MACLISKEQCLYKLVFSLFLPLFFSFWIFEIMAPVGRFIYFTFFTVMTWLFRNPNPFIIEIGLFGCFSTALVYILVAIRKCLRDELVQYFCVFLFKCHSFLACTIGACAGLPYICILYLVNWCIVCINGFFYIMHC